MTQTKEMSTEPPAFPDSLHVSPHGEVKCVRGPSGLGASRAEEKGASRLARAGVLEQYVEHGKQAQRSHGARIACFDRRVVRHAGQCPRSAPRSLLACALWRGMGGYGAAWAAWGAPSRCPRTIRASNRAIRVFTKHETRLLPGARRGVPSGPARIPRFSRNTKHETRNTAFFSNHGLCCGAAWAAMARHGRHIAPAPASLPRPPFSVASRRSPQFPSPSGLMRQWPMLKEPTSRKENVPDCTNRGTFVIALTLPG